MIYIEELSFEKKISILNFLSKRESLEIIMWLYPEAKARSLCDINLSPKDLIEGESITTYGDDFQVKKTRRVKATKDLFAKMQNEKKLIVENYDSLILYRPQTKQWLACAIEHEHILLIDDDSLLETLSSKGLKASLEAPDWW
jgi:hypothetical protein